VTSLGTQIEKNSASGHASRAQDVDVPVLVPRGEIEGLVEDEPLRGVVVRSRRRSR
jgi:hypothetical protein